MHRLALGVLLIAVIAGGAQAQFGDSALSPPIITEDQRADEIALKMEKLTDWMKDADYYVVLINQYRNFQWITAGADMQIVTATERGPVTLAITQDGDKYFLCNNSEGPRMTNEELGSIGYEGIVWTWFEGMGDGDAMDQAVNKVAQGQPIAADFDYEGATNEAGALKDLRMVLSEPELEKYRWLCAESTRAVEEVCRAIEPGMTEIEIQAMTSDALMTRKIQPTVLLVASDERVFSYRHVIATDKPVEKYVQVNICSKKWGLCVAVTRYVHFGPIPAELGRKLRAAARVCGAYLAATKDGATAGDVMAAGQKAYASVGWPEEWRMHHQGGSIAYEEREWVTYPGADMVISGNMAFAWNPTVQGAKIEDTVFLHEDGTLENLTDTGDWPTIPISVGDQIYDAPSILVR